MTEILRLIGSLPLTARVAALVTLALLTHFVVIVIRRFAKQALVEKSDRRFRKLRSIGTLTTSALVFSLYFFTFGFVLKELGVSLTAYLASASVLGLAVGFGSQGIVQDVVTGLTFIFSDLIDVGDLVEISGQTGIVRAITMRFVELENALGASVFIPNRTINNVINYPRGYIRCIVDVTLRGDDAQKQAAEERTLQLMRAFREQFPGILMTPPSNEGRLEFTSGKEILRVKFRIWPNRGQPIETSFSQELAASLKTLDPDFQPWMIAISYEAEARKSVPRAALPWRNADARSDRRESRSGPARK